MNFLKNIAEKAKSAAENSPTKLSQGEKSSNSTEGFLCPSCMSSFTGPEELQTHFLQIHASENDTGQISSDPISPDTVQPNSSIETSNHLQISEKVLERTNEMAAENVSLKATVDELSARNSALEARCGELEVAAQHRDSLDDATLLKQELIAVQKAMDVSLREKEEELRSLRSANDSTDDTTLEELTESRALVDNLQKSLQEKESLCSRLKEDCNKLDQLKEEMELKLKASNAKLTEETTKSSILDKSLNRTREDLDDKLVELEKLEAEVEKLQSANTEVNYELKKTRDNVIKLESTLENCELELSRLSKERVDLLKNIEDGEGANLAIQQLTQENKMLVDKISDLNKEHDASIEVKDCSIKSLEDQLGQTNKQLAQEIQSSKSLMRKSEDLESKCAELQDTIQGKADLEEQLKSTCNGLETELKEVIETNKTLGLANDDFSRRLDATQTKLAGSIQEVTALKSAENDLKQKLEAVEMNLETVTAENLLNQNSVKMLKEAKSILELEVGRLEGELTEANDKMNDLEQSKMNEQSRVSDLETVISATEGKVKEMQLAIEAASGKEKSLLSDLEEKSKTISAIEKENSNIVSNLRSKTSTLETLRNEKEAAEENARTLGNQIEALTQSNRELASEKQEHEIEICKLQKEFETERTKEQEKMEDLKTARELLISQVVELKETVRSNKSSFDAELQTLGEDNSQKSRQISDLNSKLETSVKNCEDLEEKLSKESAENEKKVGGLEKEKAALQSQLTETDGQLRQQRQLVDTAAVERDAAVSKLLELEAAVAAISEERRGLLERCLAAEGETERSRNLTIELRRKMDDSQAALHELGRENQSLQVDLARQSGRKWKDDTDVNECMGCGIGFSKLTNRKHHCRNCGSIFCKDCSSKQALMEGYTKPQRVCETCFGELAIS